MSSKLYVPEPEPFLTDIMLSYEMAGVVEGYAQDIVDRAMVRSPYDSGEYVGSLRTDVDSRGHFAHGPRVVGIAEATAPYAADVEANHEVMARAAGIK